MKMLRFFAVTSVSVAALVLACSSDDSNSGDGASGGTGATAADGSGAANGVASSGQGSTSGLGTDTSNATGTDTSVGTGTGAGATGSATDTGTAAAANATGSGGATGDVDGGSAASTATDWDVYVELDACTQVAMDTKPSPAILQFVIDKSTSMNETAPSTNGDSKWGATREALINSYPTLDSSLAVGEFFYPNDQDDGCVIPGEGGVDIAPLTTDQVQALIDGVNAIEDPTNPAGTPTHDAWREGLSRLQAFLAAPPAGYETARGYIVLMTDGMPVRTLNCGSADGDNIAVTEEQFNEFITDVATTTAATGIQTFVIGVPGSENENQVPTDPSGNGIDYIPRTKLSEVAIAGQTATDGCSTAGSPYCHIDMVESTDFVSALQAAIATVVESVVTCNFAVPTVDIPNVFVDVNQVEVNYYASSAPDTKITLTKSTDGCATGEWQYINDNTEVELCESACSTVRADSGARVEVDFGCLMPQ